MSWLTVTWVSAWGSIMAMVGPALPDQDEEAPGVGVAPDYGASVDAVLAGQVGAQGSRRSFRNRSCGRRGPRCSPGGRLNLPQGIVPGRCG